MEDSRYYIYLLTNNRHRIYYAGITTDIKRRMKEHEKGEFDIFSRKYGCTKLVYYEVVFGMDYAWERKRTIESLSRAYKIQLLTDNNPRWRNFADVWSESREFHSTAVLKAPPKSAYTDMAPPNRLPEEEMLSFDFEDA